MRSLDSEMEKTAKKSSFIQTQPFFRAPFSHNTISAALTAIGWIVVTMFVGCEPPPPAQNRPQAARTAGSVKLNNEQKQKLKKNIEEISEERGAKEIRLKDQDPQPEAESDPNSAAESQTDEKAADSESTRTESESSSGSFDPNPPEEHTIDIPEQWKRLSKNEVWADFKEKQVILGGYICMNMGPLEMFACPEGTKEHESVVGAKAQASEMHAALLAIGAKPGAPCSWDDNSFTTPSGSIINIELRWKDEKTNEIITRSAKEMLKHSKTEKELKLDWVFGGSRFYEEPETKEKHYIANSGEMICVSNFSTAAIDLNIPSSQINDSLMFLANPDKIPPKGTKVYLILKPGDFVEAKREPFAEPEQPAAPQPAPEPAPEQTLETGNQTESKPGKGYTPKAGSNEKSDSASEATKPSSSPATEPTTTPPSEKPSSNNG